MITKETFIKAGAGDHDSLMEIGRDRYDKISKSDYFNFSHLYSLTNDEWKEIAESCSNIDECITYVDAVELALGNEIKLTPAGSISKPSMNEYVVNHPLPENLKILDICYKHKAIEFMYKIFNKTNIELISGKPIDYIRICRELANMAYEYFLDHDEYCVLNTKAMELDRRCRDICRIPGLGWSSQHHGTLLLFDYSENNRNGSRRLTKEELITIIDYYEKLLKIAEQFKPVLKY